MSLNRFAARVDDSQGEIIKAIRKAGWQVWVIRKPVDLLVRLPAYDLWIPLEVKTPDAKGRRRSPDKRQVEQNEFIGMTGCPVVCTPEEALQALRRAVIARTGG